MTCQLTVRKLPAAALQGLAQQRHLVVPSPEGDLRAARQLAVLLAVAGQAELRPAWTQSCPGQTTTDAAAAVARPSLRRAPLGTRGMWAL